MQKKNITLTDISNKLGISKVTASNALNDKDGVSEELRVKIKEVAKEMGYVIKAPVLNGNIKHTIGVIVPEYFIKPNHSYYLSIYNMLVNELKEKGYYTILEIADRDSIKNLEIPNFIINEKVDAIITIGQLQEEYLYKIQSTGYPIVIVDSYNYDVPNTSCVMIDSYLESYNITQYLVSQNHSKIGFVGSIKNINNIQDKYFGYRKCLLKNDIEYDDTWLIEDRDGWEFKKEFDLPENMPTAFVCNCDETAFYFVNYLKNNGYKVPLDISVVAFYDYIYCTLCEPNLTVLGIDIENLVEKTIKFAFDLIEDKNNTNTTLIKTKFIKRDSVFTLEKINF